ncbi:MAG: 2-dehydropantoate 2-reductase [Robiginitomaculum sp.]
MTPLSIGIFGAGAIGGYVGGRLTDSGVDVTMVGREALASEIAAYGMTISHYDLPILTVPAGRIDYAADPSALSHCDIIFVTVKSTASAQAAAILAPIAKPDAIIISLQNGIGNPQIIRAAMPRHIVHGAMIPNNVVRGPKGHFHMGTEGDIIMQDAPHMDRLAQIMNGAGLSARLSADMTGVAWGKLLLNLNNAINTLSDLTLREEMSGRAYRKVLALSIDETLSVLKAANITPAQIGKAAPDKLSKLLRLPNFLYQPIMNRILKIDAKARSSMWEDLQRGRPTEIDFINGAVVKLGKSLRHPVPINSQITTLIHEAFENGRSPRLSGKILLNLLGK